MNRSDINRVFEAVFWQIRDYDGDSFWVLADLGLDTLRIVDLRLRNVWAPERSTEQGKLVKNYIQTELSKHDYLIVRTFKTKNRRDVMTFARYEADIWLSDGTYFNDAITQWMNDNGITDHGIGG